MSHSKAFKIHIKLDCFWTQQHKCEKGVNVLQEMEHAFNKL